MNRVSTPAVALTKEERRILAAFRKMDAKAQEPMLGVMEDMAKKWPRHARPELRLISGGAW